MNRAEAERLSAEQVVHRWTLLYSEPTVIAPWRNGVVTSAERIVAKKPIEIWRGRLYEMCWFMKAINEHLARRANGECTGHLGVLVGGVRP